jgi:serine/threonine protein kinase
MEECLKWVQMLHKVTKYRDIYDHFEIFKLLGKGHFGEVRQGVDRKTKEYVAIKIIDKDRLKHDEVECIRMEAEVQRYCHHKNILKLIDNFESYSTIYIVLEYLTGGNLTRFLIRQDEILSDKKAKTIIYQIAKGVKYLSDLGIMHRDLKPDNIMLSSRDENCVIKIVDLGLSRIVGNKTKVYDTFGTLAYVAPEVVHKTGYNKEVDIWSLGIIIYYVLSGKLPFEDCRLDFKKISSQLTWKLLDFPPNIFSHASPFALDLIQKCVTEQSKRITIERFLDHPWFHY